MCNLTEIIATRSEFSDDPILKLQNVTTRFLFLRDYVSDAILISVFPIGQLYDPTCPQ